MYFFFLIVIYLLFIIFIEVGIHRNRFADTQKNSSELLKKESIFISLLIPFHDEIKNLHLMLSDIISQSLDAAKYEVIWINDRSSDGGEELVRSTIQGISNHSLINIETKDISISGKRNALKTAIANARGNFIVFTDADCRIDQSWLNSYWVNINKTGAGVIGGPVIKKSKGLLGVLLKWEQFLSNKIAECFFGLQNPILTFGSNWGIKKDLFTGNEGYKGADKSISGDDDLLVQKISKSDLSKIWLWENKVKTKGPDGFAALWRQKRRHLSAGREYNQTGILFFGFLHLINILFLILPFFIKFAILGLLIKVIIDSFWLARSDNFEKILRKIPEVLLFEFYFVFMSWIIGTISFLFPAKRW